MKKMGMKKMIGSRKRGAPMPKAMATPKAMKPIEMEGQGPMPFKKGGCATKMAKGGRVKKFATGGTVSTLAPDQQTPLPGPDGRIRNRVGRPSWMRGNNQAGYRSPPVLSEAVKSSLASNPQVTGVKPPRLRPVPGSRGELLVPDRPIRAFKKGGAVNKKTWGSTEDITGRGPSPAAAKADYAKKMKAAGLTPKLAKGGMAKKPRGGLGIMIILGKKKGK